MDCGSSFGSCSIRLATGPVVQVATRAGLEEATVLPNGQIRVAMGPVDVRDRGVRVRTVDGAEFAALTADVGNACVTPMISPGFHTTPSWSPPAMFPSGVNMEFAVVRGERTVAMRVFERGVGETRLADRHCGGCGRRSTSHR